MPVPAGAVCWTPNRQGQVRTMQIVALDGTKLIVLMLAGGAFALAGLWLMFRPQPGGEAARIELFGLKFQAGSAGILVFLIGAAFLAVPIFVPQQEAAETGSAPVPRSEAGPGGSETDDGAVAPDLSLPRRADAEEIEPNSDIREANAIRIGQTIGGRITPAGDVDWFVFAADAIQGERFRLTLRSRGADCVDYILLDENENHIGGSRLYGVSRSEDYSIQSPQYYLRLTGCSISRIGTYEAALDYE
jgi:hypothetical protein